MEVAEMIVVLEPMFAGASQISRKKNFAIDIDQDSPTFGRAIKINDRGHIVYELDGNGTLINERKGTRVEKLLQALSLPRIK